MAIPPGIIKTSYPDGRVTYHNGTLFNGAAPVHVGAYTDNGVNVPAHFWNARWTYRPSPVVINKTPAQIVAANRMFPYGDTGIPVATIPSYLPYAEPMSPAWVTVYMPTTGERPDIGLCTDPGAYFMMGQSPAGMLAAASASGSFPHHYRDETTGKPINLIQYPQANCYESPAQGAPWFQRYPLNPDGSNNLGGGMVTQQAHFVEMAYLAYQATGDQSFLEEVQYGGNFVILCDAAHSTPTTAYMTGELRGIAWGLRELFMAHVATQDAEAAGALPASCQPSSYWKTLLDNQLAYYSVRMNDPANQVFRLLTGPGLFGPWQADYTLTALAFGVLTGHADWVPIYLWALKNAVARTNNTPWDQGGFPPGWGTPYYMDGSLPDWYSAFLAMYPSVGSPPPTQAQINTLKADPLNGGKAITGFEYLQTTRAALIMADYLDKKGLANVRGTYPELDKCIQICTAMNKNVGYMNPRVSVISTGETPPMGKPFTVQVGQSVDLPITWDAAGQPAQKPTEIAVTATPAGLVNITLAADGSKAAISGVAPGSPLVKVTGKAGATILTDTSQGTVTAAQLPLATAIHINA